MKAFFCSFMPEFGDFFRGYKRFFVLSKLNKIVSAVELTLVLWWRFWKIWCSKCLDLGKHRVPNLDLGKHRVPNFCLSKNKVHIFSKSTTESISAGRQVCPSAKSAGHFPNFFFLPAYGFSLFRYSPTLSCFNELSYFAFSARQNSWFPVQTMDLTQDSDMQGQRYQNHGSR